MSASSLRDQSCRLARKDPQEALRIARQIDDPWFRCQALAYVARFGREDEVERLVQEALDVAAGAENPYKAACVTAWPLRALIERGRLDMLHRIAPGLIERARQVTIATGASESLFEILQSLHPGPPELRAAAFAGLVDVSIPIRHWRHGRNLRDAILMMARPERALADRAFGRMEECSWKRQVARAMAERAWREPRDYFS